jgi:NADH-quinone oxidoreductase subunit H
MIGSVLKILFSFLIFPGFLFTAVVGLFLTWVDRKVSARIQWRVGPPWFQPFADFFKLLSKESTIPDGVPKIVFLGAPIVSLVGITIVAAMLGFMNLYPRSSFLGDLIVVVYFLAFIPIGIIIGGSASKNPLAVVGAAREMNLYFSYELPLLVSVVLAVVKTHSIRIGEMILYQQAHHPVLYSVSGVIAFLVALVAVQAKLGYAPFDIPDAEQEIMAGPYVEYSGVALALFKLTRAMTLFVMPVFLITIFWGGVRDLWAIPKFLLIVVLVILIKNTNPRLRVDQALKFFWIGLGTASALGMILALTGL